MPLHCNVREQCDSLIRRMFQKAWARLWQTWPRISKFVFVCVCPVQIWKFGVIFVIVGLKPFGTPVLLTKQIVHEHYNVKASTKIYSESCLSALRIFEVCLCCSFVQYFSVIFKAILMSLWVTKVRNWIIEWQHTLKRTTGDRWPYMR